MAPSIVFDFDGTLAIGHGPVRAYALKVAESAGSEYLDTVDEALASYDAGKSSYRDGYDIVGSLAANYGINETTLQQAYADSREILGTELAPVATMTGLAEFLATLRGSAQLVLATNAPEAGIRRVLESWGATDSFDQLHFTAAKPAGLHGIVEPLLQTGPVLSIGDIVEFDLAPAAALGADTALVGATAASSNFSATMRGESLAALAAEITAWAVTAASSNPERISSETGIER